ncbi:helix-turn-helix domain-containing protein [Nocardia sp. NPDC050175]|uniref:helix-turn-helix domain-containing protein n=1 Tax=Nocardia sp. NPDC050175 TaxID=3364317 RepID=UPI00378A49BC
MDTTDAPPPRLDYSAYPSIVIPLEATARVGLHSHPQHQLTWVPDGVLAMEVDAYRWIVQRSRALWIPGDTPHSVVPNSPVDMLSLFFDPAECPHRWDKPTVIDATGLVGPLLTYLVGLPNGADAERARANAVLWDLVKPMSVTTIPTILPTDPQARQVALAIKNDPTDSRGLEEWGRQVGASQRTLSRRFRSETGVSFESWRTFERLNAALPLLGAGLTVSQVARSVGYKTASAFITAFRREIGTTPAAYFGGSGADYDRSRPVA